MSVNRLRTLCKATTLLLAATGVTVLGNAAPATATPPANDDFAAAEVIAPEPGGASVSRYPTLVEATLEDGEPDHNPAGAPAAGSVWYSITPDTAGNLTVWSGGTDPALAIYTGPTLATLTQVAQNDDESPGWGSSRIDSLPVDGGTTYWIAVTATTWQALSWVSFRLSPTPLNDMLANPAPLIPGYRATTFNARAGVEEGEASLWQAAWATAPEATLWWRFSPGRNGTLDLEATGIGQDVRIAVLSAAPGSASMTDLEPVALSEAATPTSTLTDIPVKGRKSYYVSISGATANDRGQVQLTPRWAPSPHPDNDSFGDATFIPNPAVDEATGVEFDSAGSTTEPGEPDHAPGVPVGGSVWFSFVAPSTGMVEASLPWAAFDSVAVLYRGTSLDTMTRVGSDRGATAVPTRATRVRAAVTMGETYHVAVLGVDGSSGDTELWLRFGLRPIVTSTSTKRGSTSAPNWVTIRGAHLDAYGAAVWFGDRRVRYLDSTDPSDPGAVVVRVPTGLPRGPLRITVRTWAGTAATRPLWIAGVPYILRLSETVVPRRGGVWVVVYGRDFDGTTSVKVGGVPARSFRVLRPTVMRVLIPRHAPGRVRVSARDRWGGVGVSSVTMRYR